MTLERWQWIPVAATVYGLLFGLTYLFAIGLPALTN
jgi:hypothetical protein